MTPKCIYQDPREYAKLCDIPLDLAKIACKKYRHHQKEFRKKKPKCPICHRKTLYIEDESYEEGYSAFISCENCGSDFSFSEIPNSEYIERFWDDFDPVLYFANMENKKEGRIAACGDDSDEAWEKFARNQILGRRDTVSEIVECEFLEECDSGNICHAGENDESPNPFICSAVEDENGDPLQ